MTKHSQFCTDLNNAANLRRDAKISYRREAGSYEVLIDRYFLFERRFYANVTPASAARIERLIYGRYWFKTAEFTGCAVTRGFVRTTDF